MLQMPSQLCSNDPQSLMASVSPSIAIRNSNSFLNNNQSVFNANRPCQKPVCAVKPLCQSQPSQETNSDVSNKGAKEKKSLNNKNRNLPQKVYERVLNSPWYHGQLSTYDARDLLKNSPVGTFLVRDSESPNHVFSISARTSRGTTSVRISYDANNETFTLDVGGLTNEGKISQSPRFHCVTDMINYLTRVSGRDRKEQCLCIESDGRNDTPFVLIHPLPILSSVSDTHAKVMS